MKDEKKAPKLRFKGFTDDWEQCKLSDISEKSYEKNTDNKYSTVLTNSAEYGIVKQRDFFDKDIANSSNISGYYVVRKNYFVYNPRISNQAKFGPINRNKLDESGIMSPLYLVFTVHDIDESFLETLFQTTTWHRFMYQNGDTGARADRFAIKDSTFMSMPIKVPSLEEQHKLALAFHKLDQTITLHEEKKRQLERLKSALLHKMFADKSGYPDVRFKGFNEAWTNRKLGNYFDYEQPTPYIVTNTNYSDKYNTPVLTAGQSFILGYTNEDTGVKFATYKEPVIIFDDFTTSTHLVTFPFKVKSSAMKILTLTQKNDSMYFGYTSLQNIKYKPLNHERQWISIFSKIKIGIPISKIEERKIGNLFERIDRLDNYFQQKIERLNLIKQSLLQSMFI
ncbi:type I restriction-modification system specificity subunit S [Lactobacillus delbrueckii]|uniref:restriction endonuclease subunit S n=1 Tax=Lactobacillus delbrueckii TaxID=1584 RepID=UPI001F2BD82F|nr:restriction endonuclease subunit S [Lactobacillus delbrueckii]GHN32002.1 type I restriction-modification system specificity subunit S [Lactobacillus delbrueckii]